MTPRGTHTVVCVCVCVCVFRPPKESRLLHHFTPDELPRWSSRVTMSAPCCGSMLKLGKESTTVQSPGVMTWALPTYGDWHPYPQL